MKVLRRNFQDGFTYALSSGKNHSYSFLSKFKNKNRYNLVRGFTIMEMIITLGIFTVMGSVVLYDYSSYNDKQALSSVTQEVALAIRQAQNFSLNVKETNVGSGEFNSSYGIHFTPNDNQIFSNYIDNSPADGDYDKAGGCGTNPTECTGEITLRYGVKIEAICTVADDNTETCPPVSGVALSHLNITFFRPNPEAQIKFTNAGGGASLSNIKRARVKLISPKNKHSSVTIERTGQVYVQ